MRTLQAGPDLKFQTSISLETVRSVPLTQVIISVRSILDVVLLWSPGSSSTFRAFASAPSSPPTTDGWVGDIYPSPNFTYPHHSNGHPFQKLVVSHSELKVRNAASVTSLLSPLTMTTHETFAGSITPVLIN